MRKTIKDMAEYLLNLLPPEIPATFEIDEMFHDILHEEAIRDGICAFKDFLCRFYGSLIAKGNSFDKPKKEAHPFADGINISTSYPFICNLAVILLNIGSHGILSKSGDSIILDDIQLLTAKNNISNLKIPDSRIMDCLRFLEDCGIRIGGIDLNEKKPNFISLGFLEVSYPENPIMLTGLKVMAIAQRDLITKTIQDVLLRCDYRVLAKKETDIFMLLNDLVYHLPADVREFVIKLHQDYMKYGYKVEYSTTSFYMRFTYFCRSKELWRLNSSLNNGFSIGIKALNTDKYADIIKDFPEWLQSKIAKGYGCGKTLGTSTSCDGGCRGFRVPLDDSFMETSEVTKKWINAEVSLTQKK